MARQNLPQQAQTLYNQGQGMGAQGQGVENSTYATLFPTFSKMARGESTPGSIAANTAAQQSAGGSMSSVVGQGNAQAARTGNSGGYAAAMDRGAQNADKTLSTQAADVKAGEEKAGLSGLSNLYNSGVGQQEAGASESGNALKAEMANPDTGWFGKVLKYGQLAGKLAGDAAGAGL